MALSQISFFTLPQKTFQKLSQSHLKKEDHLFDDSVYWASERAPCDFFAKIGSFLPINTSWSKQITLYGQQDSNCFEVLCEDQIILSVSFRIDFTSDYEDILRNLIEFFITNDLLILDDSVFIDESTQKVGMNSVSLLYRNGVFLFRTYAPPADHRRVESDLLMGHNHKIRN
jgi:hypothetical protein